MTRFRSATTSEILRETARLVRAGWTRLAMARDVRNQEVPVMSPRAACFCVSGAFIRAAGTSPERFGAWRLLEDHVERIHGRGTLITAWNDVFVRNAEEIAFVLERLAEEVVV